MIVIVVLCVADKPGPPGVPDITEVHRRTMALKWTPPHNDGGNAVFNYVIEYKMEGGFKWTRANDHETVDQLRYTVRNLKEDLVYEFRVAAENKAGVGEFSQATGPTRAEERVGEQLICSLAHFGTFNNINVEKCMKRMNLMKLIQKLSLIHVVCYH